MIPDTCVVAVVRGGRVVRPEVEQHPVFVVEVSTLVEPSLLSESAGSPEWRSVIATNEDQVSRAYSRSGSPDA